MTPTNVGKNVDKRELLFTAGGAGVLSFPTVGDLTPERCPLTTRAPTFTRTTHTKQVQINFKRCKQPKLPTT